MKCSPPQLNSGDQRSLAKRRVERVPREAELLVPPVSPDDHNDVAVDQRRQPPLSLDAQSSLAARELARPAAVSAIGTSALVSAGSVWRAVTSPRYLLTEGVLTTAQVATLDLANTQHDHPTPRERTVCQGSPVAYRGHARIGAGSQYKPRTSRLTARRTSLHLVQTRCGDHGQSEMWKQGVNTLLCTSAIFVDSPGCLCATRRAGDVT